MDGPQKVNAIEEAAPYPNPVDQRKGLPFLHISLYPHLPGPSSKGVASYALVDTGSTSNLMNSNFFKNSFSNHHVQEANSILRFGSGETSPKIGWKTTLYLRIRGEHTSMLFEETFLLVPNTGYDIVLGQALLTSAGFCCYTPRVVYFHPTGSLISNLIDAHLTGRDGTVKAPLTFIHRNSGGYLELGEGETGPDPNPENYSPTNGTTNSRSQERNDIQEQHSVEIGSSLRKTRDCPYDEGTTSAYKEVMDTPILQPSDRTPTLHRPIIDDDRRQLDKLLDRFEIDPEDREEFHTTYHRTGKAGIPVTKYVEEAGKVDAFSETPKIYYSTLEELIELLDINHLPENNLQNSQNSWMNIKESSPDTTSTLDA